MAKKKPHSAAPSRPPAPAPAPARVVAAAPPPWRTVAHVLPLLSLPILVAILYWPSLRGPFVFDDPNAVSQSELIRTVFPLTRFVTFSTRPLTDLSYALNYAMDGLQPWPYHLTNIALHALNAALVYVLAWQTLGLPATARRYGAWRRAIAWAAAAAFAVHPLATETVAYISSRSEALVASFFLAALVVYVAAATAVRSPLRHACTIALPLATAAALGSKESALMIPPALLLYDWCFLASGQWGRTRPRWLLLAASLLPLVAGGLFLVYRAYAAPTGLGTYGATAGIGFDRFTRWEYLMTQFGVITHYLRLVVLPIGLNFDYDWPLARTPWAPGVVLPFLLLVALLALAVRSVRAQPLFAFAVLWTFLVLAPTSSLLPIADLAVERRMYVPLVGLMLCAAAAGRDLAARLRAAEPARAAVVTYALIALVPLAAWASLTYTRAALWGDAVALHVDGATKAPKNPRLRLNLGVTYLNLNRLDDAERELAEAKRLYDTKESIHAFQRIGAFIHYNLGAVLYLRQRYADAAPQLERSLELGGEYLALRPMALYLLGRIAAHDQQWPLAVTRYQEAIKYNANNPVWYVDLAQALAANNDQAQARQTLEQLLFRYPNFKPAVDLLNKLRARPARPRAVPTTPPG